MRKLNLFFLFISNFILISGTSEQDEGTNPSPEKSATFPSKLLFNWFNTLVWAGYKKSLGEDDLADLNPRDVSANVVPKFNRSFDPKLAAARLSCKDTAPAAANVSFGANAEEVKFNTGKLA